MTEKADSDSDPPTTAAHGPSLDPADLLIMKPGMPPALSFKSRARIKIPVGIWFNPILGSAMLVWLGVAGMRECSMLEYARSGLT